MSPETLAAWLHQVADEIGKDASFEGRITWAVPGMGEWVQTDEEIEAAASGHLLFVEAAVRNGNDMGQGGIWLVGEIDEQGVPVQVEHAAPDPASFLQVTEARRDDIRARLVNDIARHFAVLGTEEVWEIADLAMHDIEHLLAEIEGLRTDNSLREST